MRVCVHAHHARRGARVCVPAGQLNTSFKRRYFVLNGGKLSYFDSDDAKAPKGSIDVHAIRDVRVSGRHTRPSPTPGAPPPIEIETGDRSWVVAAPSADEHEMWMRVLRRAADLD